jgi:hypothetical protein
MLLVQGVLPWHFRHVHIVLYQINSLLLFSITLIPYYSIVYSALCYIIFIYRWMFQYFYSLWGLANLFCSCWARIHKSPNLSLQSTQDYRCEQPVPGYVHTIIFKDWKGKSSQSMILYDTKYLQVWLGKVGSLKKMREIFTTTPMHEKWIKDII